MNWTNHNYPYPRGNKEWPRNALNYRASEDANQTVNKRFSADNATTP